MCRLLIPNITSTHLYKSVCVSPRFFSPLFSVRFPTPVQWDLYNKLHWIPWNPLLASTKISLISTKSFAIYILLHLTVLVHFLDHWPFNIPQHVCILFYLKVKWGTAASKNKPPPGLSKKQQQKLQVSASYRNNAPLSVSVWSYPGSGP